MGKAQGGESCRKLTRVRTVPKAASPPIDNAIVSSSDANERYATASARPPKESYVPTSCPRESLECEVSLPSRETRERTLPPSRWHALREATEDRVATSDYRIAPRYSRKRIKTRATVAVRCYFIDGGNERRSRLHEKLSRGKRKVEREIKGEGQSEAEGESRRRRRRRRMHFAPTVHPIRAREYIRVVLLPLGTQTHTN